MKLEELCAAVQEARYYNERFTRREYTSAFRTYTERFGPLYMEAVRETAEDPDGRRVLAEQLLDLLEADPGHRHHRLAEASGRGELNRAPARKRKNLPGNGKNMKKLFDNRAHIPYNTIRVITR